MLKKILIGFLCVETSLVAHEASHFAAMRANGVEVAEVSIGVGPVIYVKQFADFQFSVRLIPIMAYVAPSQKGGEIMLALPLLNVLLIDLAGVFTNLLLASLIFLGLRQKESPSTWLADVIRLPKNYFLLFKDALLYMVTIGGIVPKDNGALILEKEPRIVWRYFLLLNLTLGVLNLLPVKMLDGGQIFFLLLVTALQQFRVSEKSAASILTAANFAMLLTLFFLIMNSLPMHFVKVLNPPENKENLENKTTV